MHATTFNVRMRRWSGGQKFFTAKNPAYGAILNYYLKDAVPPEPPKTEGKGRKGQRCGCGKVIKRRRTRAKTAAEEKSKSATEPKKEGRVKISVADKDGKVVREFDGPGAAGVNRVNWTCATTRRPSRRRNRWKAINAGYRERRVAPGRAWEVHDQDQTRVKEATQEVMVEDDPRIQLSAEGSGCEDAQRSISSIRWKRPR